MNLSCDEKNIIHNNNDSSDDDDDQPLSNMVNKNKPAKRLWKKVDLHVGDTKF